MASQWIGAAVVLVSALGWWIAALVLERGGATLRGLGSALPRPDAELPSLAIASTARNEAERASQATRSFLAQEYRDLRVLVVDDRSTDATGAILDRLASTDPRLRVIHLTELPQGWIGKSHALARAAAEIESEWILFADGDVVLAPDAVRRAVSLALELGADHLAVGPDLEVAGIGEAAFIAYFSAMFHLSERPWAAPDPRSSAHIGIGAFNLVRRAAYDKAGRHDAIRMEILDDMALGLAVKRSGGRSYFAVHDGLVRARWHAGLGGLIRGVEKNAFAALRFSVPFTLFALAGQIAVSIAPLVGLFLPGTATKAVAVAAWVGVAAVYRALGRHTPIRAWHAITLPVGALLFSYAIARSMVLTLARGGVVWRGTFYTLEALKRGRVR